ncbi:MAG: ABC transporter ATP-binding protein [Planctomycetes bacterium]|nr:ABC transporter ATP-binding protein [Planctomycetota bacterium]
MSFLVLERLEKTWPDGTRAVKAIDLAIEPGEFVVLLGPSGCGKTTTLRMIAGLETPTAGRVLLAGDDVTRRTPAERDIGFVFQFYALYPHLSVAENVAFPLACAKVARAERDAAVARVAERIGITALLAKKPRQLSGGDQQKVGLARALVRKPAVWLMDEPLGTLDSSERLAMCEFLREQQLEQRVPTVYVTHDQEEAMRLADRVVVMAEGSVLQAAPPAVVYSDPATLFVARFVGSPGMNLVEGELVDGGGAFRTAGMARPLPLAARARSGPVVLGARPEFVRFDASSPLRGRVAVDAFHGPCRYAHVEGVFGRVAARRGAEERASLGDEVGLAFDPAGVRLFDPATGGRLA